MDKAPVASRLGRWYADFRGSSAFPRLLWAFTAACIALHFLFGLDPAFAFFLGALSVEASLATAYLSQDSRSAAERQDKQLQVMSEMLRHQTHISEAILEATRDSEERAP